MFFRAISQTDSDSASRHFAYFFELPPDVSIDLQGPLRHHVGSVPTFFGQNPSTNTGPRATLISVTRKLYVNEPFRPTKAAVPLHTLLDLRGNIPSFLHINDGKLHEVNIFYHLIPEAGAFYVVDRRYIDFAQLHRLHQVNSYFVIGAKSNLRFARRCSQPSDRTIGIICDQLGVLAGFYSAKHYPAPLRLIRCKDEHGKTLVLLTNNIELKNAAIRELNHCRWQVELLFKWLKQHLDAKVFSGTSENAVKSQIWIAVPLCPENTNASAN